MEKIGNDQWTAEGVSSAFKVSIPQKQTGRLYTESCGFGWRFTYGTMPRNTRFNNSNSTWRTGEQPTLYLGFDPYCLSGSNLGSVVVKTRCTNSQAAQDCLFTASLSTNYSSYDNYAAAYIQGVETCTFTFDTVELLQTAIVTFSLSFSSCPDVHLPVRPPPSATQKSILRTLGSAVSGADLNDVEFVLPSFKRNGNAVEYKAVYGNREALKGVSDYLDTLLFDEHFAESKPQPFAQYSRDAPSHELDYADDSDIDGDESWAAIASRKKKRALKPGKKVGSPSSSTGTQNEVINGPLEVGKEEPDAADGAAGRKGRVVRINDFAYQTWRSLVLYLYTGEITFCALKSSGTRQESWELPPTACSPKSMYRVAHMLEMKELQDVCLQNIKSQLDPKNIVRELFSVFTSRYTEVRDMEVAIFKTHYTACAQERKRMMLKVAKGELPHCGEVVNAFMDLLA
ncbi:uncharacterized protein SCHCODRAFT_02511537 [Schizophyllum commune H4-8]|uniref:uncharacterized protein n=1 Tax=Schizophyllum commune (strain H4-8 / FGSC 9210) TaxID=578458 RepID=UPI00215F3EA2|nr:uncharacterized protein SCHCODRAFT_02511537 [Schizophyllum commune H4-8]KAI5889779.1 hypothetical protein SCHCODRAFT_02511537 [Schizophyllum commune H4-8]